MKLLNELSHCLENGTQEEKLHLLSHLHDVFESYIYRPNELEDLEKIVGLLITYAITSQDEELVYEALDTIVMAEMGKNLQWPCFDELWNNMRNVKEKILARCIDILSFTHNKKYLPAILEYSASEDAVVRQAVQEALQEFGVTP